MADKNQLKIADQVDLADDDPFAELTRIMGFDPRQPARQSAPDPEPAPVEAAADDDDFTLDLEKELLGGFDLEDEPESAQGELAAEPSVETSEAVDSDLAEVDFDFADAFDEAMDNVAQTDASGEPDANPVAADVNLSAPEESEPSEVDLDFSGAFDEAINDIGQADVSDHKGAGPLAPDVAASAPDDEAPEINFDFFGDEATMVAPEAFDVPASAEPEPSFDGDLDAAFAAATDDVAEAADEEEAALDFDLAGEDVPGPAESAPAPALPVTPEAVARDAAIDDDIDAAMADFMADEPVFEAPGEPTHESDAQAADVGDFDLDIFDEDFRLQEEAAAVSVAEPPFETESDAQPDVADGAFQFGEDDLLADESPAAAEQVVPHSQEDEFAFEGIDFGADDDVVADDAAQAGIRAIEPPDDNDDAVFAAPEPPEAPAMPSVPRKLPISPMDVAAEEFRQREATAAPAGPEFNLEDELNALLGNIKQSQKQAEAAPPAVHS